MIKKYRKLRLLTYAIPVFINIRLFFSWKFLKYYILKTLDQMKIGEKKIEISQNFSDEKYINFQ